VVEDGLGNAHVTHVARRPDPRAERWARHDRVRPRPRRGDRRPRRSGRGGLRIGQAL